jgi:hypothetical protein
VKEIDELKEKAKAKEKKIFEDRNRIKERKI